MYAVIFEVYPSESGKAEYLEIAKKMRSFLVNRPGLISIERFESLSEKGKILSLSFWESEESIADWRNVIEHRQAQKKGKEELFNSYRIRVAKTVRDYTSEERNDAPDDSNTHFA